MTKIFFYDKNFFLTKSFFMTKQSVRVHSRDVSRPKNDLRVFDKLRMKDSLTGISVRSLVFEPTKLGNPVENKYDQNHEPRRKKDGYKNTNNTTTTNNNYNNNNNSNNNNGRNFICSASVYMFLCLLLDEQF